MASSERTKRAETAADADGATTAADTATGATSERFAGAESGDQGGCVPGRPTTAGGTALTDIDRTRFRCIRNAAYHDDRERFYARLHRWAMFVVVLSGTAAFATITQQVGIALVASAAATIAGIADLLFNLDGRARLHSGLKRRIFDLLARCETAIDCREIEAEMIRLYADEPPTMHGVNALAHNSAVNALGRQTGQRYVLRPWQILIRHIWPFRADSFSTEADLKKLS